MCIAGAFARLAGDDGRRQSVHPRWHNGAVVDEMRGLHVMNKGDKELVQPDHHPRRLRSDPVVQAQAARYNAAYSEPFAEDEATRHVQWRRYRHKQRDLKSK